MAFLLIVDADMERSAGLLRRLRSFGHKGIVLSERSARWTLDRGLRPDVIIVQRDEDGAWAGRQSFGDGHGGPAILRSSSSDPEVMVRKVLEVMAERQSSASSSTVS